MPHVGVQEPEAAVSGLLDPAGVVVVLEVSRPVGFVQEPDLPDHFPADQQASAGAMVQLHPGSPPLHLGPGIGLEILGHGPPGVMVLLRVQEAGFRMGGGELHHPLQPPAGDHDVVVQDTDVRGQRRPEPLVHRPDEPQVFLVADENPVPGRVRGQARQERPRLFTAPVVDKNQAVGRPGVPSDGLQAPPGQGRLVPDGDDDVADGFFYHKIKTAIPIRE